MAVMGDSDICVLRGHGVVVCGASVEDATIKAIKLDGLAKLNLQAVHSATCRRFLKRIKRRLCPEAAPA